MNRKGFTLIELIVTITIIGIIMLMVSPAVIEMKKNIEEKQYNTVINNITTAAIRWGSDNLIRIPKVENDYTNQTTLTVDCATITVGQLIKEGYLVGEDKTKNDEENNEYVERVITDPRNDTEMNSYVVCVRYNNSDVMKRKLVSYIIGVE